MESISKNNTFTDMNNHEKKQQSKELRIPRIDLNLHQQLVNISKHKGIPMTSMLKPVLKDFVDSQPDRYKKPYQDDF